MPLFHGFQKLLIIHGYTNAEIEKHAEVTFWAASKLQASERGRAARKRRRKAPPPQKPKQKYATGRKIENKQPSKHDEHQLDMPVERVRAVVVRLHEAFPKARGGVLGRGDGVEGWRGE